MVSTSYQNPTERHSMKMRDGTQLFRVAASELVAEDRIKTNSCKWCAVNPTELQIDGDGYRCNAAICTTGDAAKLGMPEETAVYLPADEVVKVRLTGTLTTNYSHTKG